MSKIVKKPIPLFKGEDRIITIDWERNKSPVPITGYIFRADVKDKVGGTTYFTLTSGGGDFVITDGPNGKYEVHFSKVNMDLIPSPVGSRLTFPFTNVVIDIEALDGASKPVKVLLSVLQVFEEVTTSG